MDLLIPQIRQILSDHARLGSPVEALADTDDLYRAGLTSHACVTVMLACEDTFDIEFPAELLKKSTFGSIGQIAEAVGSIDASLTGPATH